METSPLEFRRRVVIALIVAFVIFLLSVAVQEFQIEILSQDAFLTSHVFLEVFSSFFALAIFMILYFTFDVFRYKHYLILANVFFITAIIDILHMLSYQGMDTILSGNMQTPTWLWIASRLILGLGILWSFLVDREKQTNISKENTLIFSIIIVVLVTIVGVEMVDLLPELNTSAGGLTTLKQLLEIITTTIYMIALFVYITSIRGKYIFGFSHMIQGLIFMIFSEMGFAIYRSLFDSVNFLAHINKLIAYGFIFFAIFVKTVRKPYERLYEQKETLSIDVKDLRVAVEDRTQEIYHQNRLLAKANDKLQQDLTATRAIQRAFFPDQEKRFGDVVFHSETRPLDGLSGDYINYFSIDKDHVAFYIMDVAGHGVPAAMLGVLAANGITESINLAGRDGNAVMPSEVLSHLYRIYNKTDYPDEVHLVMLFGVYHKDTNEVSLSSAGLNCLPILIPYKEEAYYLEVKSGFPICVLGELYTPFFEDLTIPINQGDKLFIYTDGLLEMKLDQWGEEGLLKFMNQHREATGESLKASFIRHVRESHFDMEQVDDITFGIIERDL